MIVITGATGNVGRPLTASLVSAGHEVTAVARGTSADLPGGPGIIPVAADLTDPAALPSLAATMAGAEALFLLVPGSGARVDAAALLETAATAGVRRVVLLSPRQSAACLEPPPRTRRWRPSRAPSPAPGWSGPSCGRAA